MTTGDQALGLLILAEAKIDKRRQLESICGYPGAYGEDEELLEAIRRHLKRNAEDVARVASIMEYAA